MAAQHQLIGWTLEEWNSMQNLVKQEVNRVRKVHNLLTHINIEKGNRQVQNEKIDQTKTVSVDDTKTIPLIELSSTIEVDRQQLDAPSKSACKLAFLNAAKSYGKAVDMLLLNGGYNKIKAPLKLPENCSAQHGPNNDGLRDFGLRGFNHVTKKQKLSKSSNPLDYPQTLIAGIMEAKSTLQTNGYEGPYILILSPKQYQAVVFPTKNLQLPITTIEKLISPQGMKSGEALTEGVIIESSGLNDNESILISPENIDVCWNYDGDVQIINPSEPVSIRIFGTFALRIKDPNCGVLISYEITKA